MSFEWLKAVFLHVYCNYMVNMERSMPLYTIAYCTSSHLISWTAWRIYILVKYKHGIIPCFSFLEGLFCKRNRKHFFPVFPYVIEMLVEVWENLKLHGNTHPVGLCIQLQFPLLPNFHSCFYNCMETRKMFSIS